MVMCSVMHLVDNNIELIESKRNAIQRLYGLLVSDNEADTDRQENGYHKQVCHNFILFMSTYCLNGIFC